MYWCVWRHQFQNTPCVLFFCVRKTKQKIKDNKFVVDVNFQNRNNKIMVEKKCGINVVELLVFIFVKSNTVINPVNVMTKCLQRAIY